MRRRSIAPLLAALAITAGVLSASAAASTSGTHLPLRGFLPQIARDAPAGTNSFRVDFIDVGEGDATLVTVDGRRLLIDAGRSGTTITQRLAALGVSDLDAVVATHPDADHVGGLAAVLAAYSVERIYVNGDPSSTATYDDLLAAAAAEGVSPTVLRRGDRVLLGGLELVVLSPLAVSNDTNNDSVVLRMSCGAIAVQFEGDAEAPAERSMLDSGLTTDIDILKVGHHGSNTASSEDFLQATRPEVAVISAGLSNQFGHPHPEIVSRLVALGVQLQYTDTTTGDDTKVLTSDCRTYSFTGVPGGPAGAPTAATATVTATPSPTPSTGAACGGATAVITALDKAGEVVTLSATGGLAGWKVVSLTGNQSFAFPAGFVGSGVVRVKSGTAMFVNTASDLWWTSASIWLNTGNDDAALVDCNGVTVQTFDDGQ
jgi:beta-lactamase superfamily II metal-dependent hydrolase